MVGGGDSRSYRIVTQLTILEEDKAKVFSQRETATRKKCGIKESSVRGKI
jgi:hypothetical protein